MAAANVSQYASLYVGDLQPDVTEEALHDIFSAIGPIGSIRICKDSLSRRSLGYGYINYNNKTDAERALESLNHAVIHGRPCRVMWTQRDPAMRRSGTGNVFVKNLDEKIDNKALADTFTIFGNILSCKVACDPTTGKSRGYGFVHYESAESARAAIEKVNGMLIGDRTVEVQLFKKKIERDDGTFTNLYVKNLPDDADEEYFLGLFTPFGTVTSHVLRQDKLERKFGFVNFAEHEQALAAIEALHGTDMRTVKDGTADPETECLYVSRGLNKQERMQDYAEKSGLPNPAAKSGSGKGKAGVNLYVKNLHERMTKEALEGLFAQFGTVTSAVATLDEHGTCKGFGFVCFSTPEEAQLAVTKMHLKVVNGKPLYVGLAEKKDERRERLRNRFESDANGGKMGGKGAHLGTQMGGPQIVPQSGNQPLVPGGQMGTMPMMGKGGMCGQMPVMGKGCPMGPGKGPMMGMMPAPMMSMMGGKGPMGMMPQMMGMMGGKGPMSMMPRPMGMRPMQPGNTAPQQPNPNPRDPGFEKQLVGEKIFPAVQRLQPALAGKITGMMLEMSNADLNAILENDEKLKEKVDEAVTVLNQSTS